jgi:hypothetical protein
VAGDDRQMNKHLLHLIALISGLALIFAPGAAGERKVERFGNLIVVDDGGISPSKLPRHGSAPVSAHILGEIGTVDGTHPPALRNLELEVDKTLAIDAVGLPVCRVGQLTARSSVDAKRACGDAIVGSGEAEVEVSFPEQAPFSSTGPLILFNGGVHGKTTSFLLHAYVNVPAPTAIVVPATVTRIHNGRFGLRIQAKIPRIAGGAGSPTRFELKIGRRYTYRGRRKSLLSAGCPTGSWATKGNVLFDDGTRAGLTHVFPCTPQG